MQRILTEIAVLLAVLIMGVIVWANYVKAHEDGGQHYPIECCHQMDCAPGEAEVKSTKFAGMFGFASRLPSVTIITTKHGSAPITDDTKRFESTDGRIHGCIRRPAGGAPYLKCVFFPPGL